MAANRVVLHLAAGSADHTIALWDSRTTARLATLAGHTQAVDSVAFHPDRPLLVSGEENGRIILWDTTRVPLTGHTDTITAVAFSPDNHTLATTSTDRTVKLWNWRRRTLLATLPAQPGPLRTVAFNPNGRTLAVGGGSPRCVAVGSGGLSEPLHRYLVSPFRARPCYD
jgi:WD40 repeat protein